jgi:hypothetical protein
MMLRRRAGGRAVSRHAAQQQWQQAPERVASAHARKPMRNAPRALLHLAERGVVEELVGGGRERHVQAEEVALGQRVVEAHQLDAQCLGALRRRKRVVRNHRHAQPLGAARHLGAHLRARARARSALRVSARACAR